MAEIAVPKQLSGMLLGVFQSLGDFWEKTGPIALQMFLGKGLCFHRYCFLSAEL